MTEPNPNPNPDPNPNPNPAPKPWHDGLDATIRGHIENKGWKIDDPKALVTEMGKAWKGLEQHFGAPADQILKLPKDATDEAGWSAVRQRLGMPKEAKEYDFSTLKRADGRDLDTGFVDTLKNSLHKAGVAKDSAVDVTRAVVKFLDDADSAVATARSTTLKTERDALTKEWGTNFDYNKVIAAQGAKRLGVDQETVNSLEGVVGYAKIMEMFRKIGAGTNEDTFVQGGSGSPTTLSGAQARKEELMKDPEFAKNYLAGRQKEVQEMNSLIQLISGAAA